MTAIGEDTSGHRARLRKRLLEGGPEAFLDHELVEYLLALTIPRRDTKPLARELIAEFGGIGGLLGADVATLGRIEGLSEAAIAAIKIAEAAALRLLRAPVAESPVLSNWQALLDYLHADMAHRTVERVRVLHLDTRNRLIRDELVSEGSVDQAALYVREVVRRALELGTSSLILVHNHPSGDPKPSRADIATARNVIDACRPLGLTVHDHIIIGSSGHASFKALGLM